MWGAAARARGRYIVVGSIRRWRYRARNRCGVDRERLRTAVPHQRNRRRALREGRNVLNLLVLACVGFRDYRRAATSQGPYGAVASDRLAPRPLCRGVRPRDREALGELPAGILPPRANRGRGARDRPRTRAFLTMGFDAIIIGMRAAGGTLEHVPPQLNQGDS